MYETISIKWVSEKVGTLILKWVVPICLKSKETSYKHYIVGNNVCIGMWDSSDTFVHIFWNWIIILMDGKMVEARLFTIGGLQSSRGRR